MIPQTSDLRISFIWTETFFDLLSHPQPPHAPFNFLGRESTYRPFFEEALNSKTGKSGLTTPWHQPAGRSFWKFYLENRNPDQINGHQSFQALVPLRGQVPVTIKAAWFPGTIFPEVFFYPHGTALIITARYTHTVTLPDAIDIGFKVRREDQFDVQWKNDGTSEHVSLDTLAEKCLAVLRALALGSEAGSGVHPFEPFSILTVVRGEGVDPGVPLAQGSDLHRMLEAVTAWDRDAQSYQLPELTDANVNLKLKSQLPGHVLYGHRRGRAIWFPHRFLQPTLPRRPLACYHRNLVATSAQVESLSQFASATAEKSRNGTIAPIVRDYAKRAVIMLGLLYGGVRDKTYRTWSSRAQIEQNGFVADINYIRQDRGLSALS